MSVASAHKTLDYRNFSDLANHFVWIPFHFLPGNDGEVTSENHIATFCDKIVCTPNSIIAQEMISDCIMHQEKSYALYRLGITMHVLADTYAHQGFAGIIHEQNNVSDVTIWNDTRQSFVGYQKKLKNFFENLFNDITGTFIENVIPLGHGAVLTCPDRPYLKWSYTDAKGKHMTRTNSDIFVAAADEMCKVMQRYKLKNASADVTGLPDTVRRDLHTLFATIRNANTNTRHRKWLALIAQGKFGFPSVRLEYKATGKKSWVYQALGELDELTISVAKEYSYTPSFLNSHWKLFHDALAVHRLAVITEILPRYGICAA